MIRRRRPQREIPFSFDSFLDVVANVVGIILRLIIVAWAAGRSYHGPPPPAPPPQPTFEEPVALPEPTDPLTPELEKERHELALAQARLLEETRKWEDVRRRRAAAAGDVTALVSRRQGLEDAARATKADAAPPPALSLAEIASRSKQLAEDIKALKNAPSPKQTLRYRTPVSQTLQTEEVFFECKGGRVSLVDVGVMIEEVKRSMGDKGSGANRAWNFANTTSAVGAFRMHYRIEQDPGTSRIFLSGYEIEPVVLDRGEAAEAALAPGSAFRRAVDHLDAQETAITFWVYPDSFALYRKLRDLLHDRDFVVAGRPLQGGELIGASRYGGTASRGQ
jgi:hypothetical protein